MPNVSSSLALTAAAVVLSAAAALPAAASAVTVDPILTSTDNHGGANQGKVYDYGTKLTGSGAFATIASSAGGGLVGTHLTTPSSGTAAWVWGRSDTLAFADPAGDTTKTGTRVDGHNAYVGPSWEDVVTPAQQVVLRDLTPFPAVSAVAGADGVAEHDVVVRCAAGTDVDHYPPMGNRCTALGDAGVGLDVGTTASASGRVVTRTWAWSSTDGVPHQVRFTVDWRAGDNGLGRAREWRWSGGAAGYALAQSGDKPAAPLAGPWDLLFRSVGAADGDADEGVGGLTTDVAPVALAFTASRTLQATYVVTTPATITTTFVSEATQAALDAALAAAHPALGSSPPSTTPDGTPPPASSAPGGSPGSSPVPSLSPPATSALPQRPVVVAQGRAARRGRVVKLGLAVRCPGTGPRCATRVTLRAGRKTVGTATLSTAATKTTALSVKLSAKAVRALPRRGKLTVVLRLSRGTLAPVTVSRTIAAARAR